MNKEPIAARLILERVLDGAIRLGARQRRGPDGRLSRGDELLPRRGDGVVEDFKHIGGAAAGSQ